MVDGETVTDPKQVNAKVDDLDLRLVHFVTNGPLEVYPYLLRLGEVNKRLSFRLRICDRWSLPAK